MNEKYTALDIDHLVLPTFRSRFNKRVLIQWTDLDPIGVLRELQNHFGDHPRPEISALMEAFQLAGIGHGYLNRSCLDPTDPACPVSAPNYHGQVHNLFF